MRKETALFVCALLLVSGCGTDSVSKAEVVFSDGIQKSYTENVTANAQFVYPESCKAGKGTRVKLGKTLFWDTRDEIAQLLFQDREIAEKSVDDYGTVKYQSYESAEDGAILMVYDNNYLNFATDQSAYINNVLFSDDRFDDYNGEQYQKKTDLDFMSQKEAWENVCETLDKLGVETSDSFSCYVMDHSTMAEEEKAAIALAEAEDMKAPAAKQEWTEDDDCYYFKTCASWNGYPIIPVVTGEGMDEENVTVIYDKNGIESLYINGYYPLEKEQEIELQAPEAAADVIAEYLGNLISEETYEIQKVTLCQKVRQINPEKHTADIVPVWECSVLVKYGDSSDESYVSKFYVHAETLKVI